MDLNINIVLPNDMQMKNTVYSLERLMSQTGLIGVVI